METRGAGEAGKEITCEMSTDVRASQSSCYCWFQDGWSFWVAGRALIWFFTSFSCRMELRVGNKYRLGRKIGSGSFGDIYLGKYTIKMKLRRRDCWNGCERFRPSQRLCWQRKTPTKRLDVFAHGLVCIHASRLPKIRCIYEKISIMFLMGIPRSGAFRRP